MAKHKPFVYKPRPLCTCGDEHWYHHGDGYIGGRGHSVCAKRVTKHEPGTLRNVVSVCGCRKYTPVGRGGDVSA